MTKKLVLDRAIKIYMHGDKRITVPGDEVWRVSILGKCSINGIWLDSHGSGGAGEVVSNVLLGAGSEVDSSTSGTNKVACMITGIAFKLVEV